MSVLCCSPFCVATQRFVLPHRCVPCGNGGAGRRYVFPAAASAGAGFGALLGLLGMVVMAGGVAVFLNPEPLSDFFDLFVLGEAEETIPEFLDVYRKAVAKKSDKKELLRKL